MMQSVLNNDNATSTSKAGPSPGTDGTVVQPSDLHDNSNNNNNKQPVVQGNLQALLSSYNQSENNNTTTHNSGVGAASNCNSNSNSNSNNNNNPIIKGESDIPASDVSLQLDALGRDRSSTFGSLRDRGFTFGSEFDLGLNFGLTGESSSAGMGMNINMNMNINQGNVNGTMNNGVLFEEGSGLQLGGGNVNTNITAGGDGAIPNGNNNQNQSLNIISANSSSSSAVNHPAQLQQHSGGVVNASPLASPVLQFQQHPSSTSQPITVDLNTSKSQTTATMTQQSDQNNTTTNNDNTSNNNNGGGQGNFPFLGVQFVNYSSGVGITENFTTTTQSLNNGNGTSGLSTITNSSNNTNITQQGQLQPQQHQQRPPSSGNSSQGSTSGFLNGDAFGTTNTTTNNSTTTSGTRPMTVDVTNTNANTNPLLYGQTPPSNIATSYENNHFGKRMRAGSISGRLRSMSDLEDRGIIDQQQKGILKDLIIAGNDDLQKALDKYEGGDTTELVSMINSGALNNTNANDIDILSNLDLDFLNMNEDFSDVVGAGGGGMVGSKAIPIPMKRPPSLNQSSNPSSGRSTPNINIHGSRGASPSPAQLQSGSYDGIGDLDFNGDYAGGTETVNNSFISLPQSSFANSQQQQQQQQSQSTSGNKAIKQEEGKMRSDSIAEISRWRANSLAFGGLFEDELYPEQSVGNWMDCTPSSNVGNTNQKEDVAKNNTAISSGLYILGEQAKAAQAGESGTTTAAAATAANNGENTRNLNRHELAALKRREREKKKALKEKEKQERKLQREKDMREKKEREARERQEKKEMKAALSKIKQEEKKKAKKAVMDLTQRKKKDDDMEGSDEDVKEIVSGTGRPRSLSDPNLSIGLDEHGLMHVDGPPDWVGAYSPESRKIRIERFLAKRNHRVWVKKVKYDVRKNFADSRLRVKGRFVKKEDELLMRDLMSLT